MRSQKTIQEIFFFQLKGCAGVKRYRYTGKERDEETGLYYHGARYYIPWLARWATVDPLQSEMPEWSSYNYGYCNPITWTDSTGMQPDEQQQVQENTPVNAPPIAKQKDLIHIENVEGRSSFPYRPDWGGGNVDFVFDPIAGQEYSILTQGEKHYYWDHSEGSAFFTGGAENKTADGSWAGRWIEYETGEARAARLTVETANVLAKGLMFTGASLFGFSVGAFSVQALTWQSAGSAGANFTAQMVTNKGDENPNASVFQDLGARFQQVNLTSVGASVLMKNPVGAEYTGSLFKYRLEDGFKQSFVTGKMENTEFLLNMGISGALGAYSDAALNNMNTQALNPYFKQWGLNLAEGLSSYGINTLTGLTGNVIINNLVPQQDTIKRRP